jgi:hypothetical protein
MRTLIEFAPGAKGKLTVASYEQTFADGAVTPGVANAMCTIPAGSRFRVIPNVTQAFNAGSSEVHTVGTAGTADLCLGETAIASTATGLKTEGAWLYTAVDLDLVALYIYTGTAPTTGKVRYDVEVVEGVL